MRILIDVDGPLADFCGALCAALSRRGHMRSPTTIRHWDLSASLTPEEHEEVDTILSVPGFVRKMPWVHGARDFVEALRRDGHEVLCVTSPYPSRRWIPERLEWLTPAFDRSEVLFVPASRKAAVVGDVLVEDHPGTAFDWLNAHPNGKALLVDRPWNRPGAKEYRAHPRMHRVRSL